MDVMELGLVIGRDSIDSIHGTIFDSVYGTIDRLLEKKYVIIYTLFIGMIRLCIMHTYSYVCRYARTSRVTKPGNSRPEQIVTSGNAEQVNCICLIQT